MAERKVLVKIGGEAVNKEDLYTFLKSLIGEYKLYIVCGAGREISKKLKEERVSSKFIAAGRVIRGERGKKLALGILEKQREILKQELQKCRIDAVVCESAIRFGDVGCNINGDTLAVGLSVNFYKTFIVAVKETDEKKQAEKEAKKTKLVQEGHNIEIVWL